MARAVQAIIDDTPGGLKFKNELEDLKKTISFTESRNAKLLAEKEDVIIGLQSKVFKLERLEMDNTSDLRETKNKLSFLKELQCRDSQALRRVEGDLKNEREVKKRTEVEFVTKQSDLETQLETANTKARKFVKELERLKAQQTSFEAREASWMNIIASLRTDKVRMEKELEDCGTKKKHKLPNSGVEPPLKLLKLGINPTTAPNPPAIAKPKIKQDHESIFCYGRRTRHWEGIVTGER
jgi:chromosome segregation ATPase